MKKVSAVETSFGIFAAWWSDGGLIGLDFPGTLSLEGRGGEDADLRILAEDIGQYLLGKPVEWRTRLDFGSATAFQRRVWQAIAKIPFGEVRSYAWLSEESDHAGATRAVANACGANPFPIIIPCHRVIASSGALGGFSAGIAWKKKLLDRERQSIHAAYEPFKFDASSATLLRCSN